MTQTEVFENLVNFQQGDEVDVRYQKIGGNEVKNYHGHLENVFTSRGNSLCFCIQLDNGEYRTFNVDRGDVVALSGPNRAV